MTILLSKKEKAGTINVKPIGLELSWCLGINLCLVKIKYNVYPFLIIFFLFYVLVCSFVTIVPNHTPNLLGFSFVSCLFPFLYLFFPSALFLLRFN